MGTLAGTDFPGSGHTDFQISGHTVPTNFWGTSGGHFWGQLASLFGTCFEDMCWPSLDPLFESACLPTNVQWNDWGLGSKTLRGESNRSPGSGQLADNQTPRSDKNDQMLPALRRGWCSNANSQLECFKSGVQAHIIQSGQIVSETVSL